VQQVGIQPYITQEKACRSDSRFIRKLSGTTGHRLLGTQRPQMLCVAAWVWFCLSTEFIEPLCGTEIRTARNRKQGITTVNIQKTTVEPPIVLVLRAETVQQVGI